MPRRIRIGHVRAIRMSGDVGGYALTGQAAAVRRTGYMAAAQGAYGVSGQAVALSFNGDPPGSEDFVTRRSGINVIAWQGFAATAEVTAFAKPRDTDFHSVPLYRESDPVVGSCLVFKFLGARLAANFPASGGNGPRPMVLDNASDWPTAFPFRFFVTRVPLGDAITRKKTLFECTARTGNTLTVTYVPLGLSEFDSGASFMDRVINDAAGSECQNYTRLFSAMTGADNGKGAADPAANNTLPVRSRIVGNPNYPPQGPSMFGYGYCAHPDYVNDARFNPWVPGYQGTGLGDGVSRSNIIDTSEIYIQFRAWFDTNTQLVDMTGGKIFGFQTETTTPQQIVMGMGPGGGTFSIPSTPEAPFALAKFSHTSYGSAGRVVLKDPYETSAVNADYSYQPGSIEPVTGKSWALTAINATSGQPSTGQNTPDGSSAFEHKYGRWVTFQYRIKPGKNWHYAVPLSSAWNSATQSTLTLLDAPDEWPTTSFQITTELTNNVFNVASRSGRVLSGITLASGIHMTLGAFANDWIQTSPRTPAGAGALSTLIEVKFADYGATQYTTLLSVDNYPIVFGSRGQNPHYFDDSIAGYSAMDFWGYRNTDLSSVAPYKVLYQKFAQLIISKSAIPVPLPDTPTVGVETVPVYQNAKSYDNGLAFTTTLSSADAGEQFSVGTGPSTGVVVRVICGNAGNVSSVVLGGVTLTALAQHPLSGWSTNERVFYGVGLALTGPQAWTVTCDTAVRINVQLFAARSVVAFTAGPIVSVLNNTLSLATTQDANTLTVGMLTSNHDSGTLSVKGGTYQKWTRVGNFYKDFIVTEPPSDPSIDAVVTGGAFTFSYLGRVCYLQGAVRSVPTYIPTAGQMNTLTVANSRLANNFRSQRAPHFGEFWYVKTANTYGGAFKNPYWGDYGCTAFFSGGHANTNDNTLTIAEYGATQVTFKRAVDPTPWFGTGTDTTTQENNSLSGNTNQFMDVLSLGPPVIFNYGISTIDGKPGSSHSYGSGDFIGPDNGFAACGTHFMVWAPALNQVNQYGAISALAVDFASTTELSSARVWYKHSNARRNEAGQGTAPILTQFVGPQRRVYMVTNGNAAIKWYDLALSGYVDGTGAGFGYDNADGFDGGTLFYVPSRGLLICAYRSAGNVLMQWMDVTVAQPTLGGTANLSLVLPVADPWGGATWCPDNNRIIIGSVTGNADAMYEVEIPATLTSTWTVTRRALGGGQTWPVMNSSGEFKRFHYDERIKAIFYFQFARRADQGADDAYVYKPLGT